MTINLNTALGHQAIYFAIDEIPILDESGAGIVCFASLSGGIDAVIATISDSVDVNKLSGNGWSIPAFDDDGKPLNQNVFHVGYLQLVKK